MKKAPLILFCDAVIKSFEIFGFDFFLQLTFPNDENSPSGRLKGLIVLLVSFHISGYLLLPIVFV